MALQVETENRQEKESYVKDSENMSGLENAEGKGADSRSPAELPELQKRPEPRHKYRQNLQFAALCWSLFLHGWNDGTTGPLLPRIQREYHVGFAIVSLVWVFACIGFLFGAVVNIPLSDKWGFGMMIVLGSVCQMLAYSLQAAALPFPVFVLAYTINGVGMAVQDAQANGYVVSFEDSPATKMGILHAVYGAGALVSPLAATQFAQLHRWSFHYLVSLSIASANTVFLILIFRFKTQDECLAQIGQAARDPNSGEESKMRQILGLKVVHLLAIFILVYVGVEVTIAGWIVTFEINVRGGGPSSGYISSGFFGGLMLGRVGLLWANRKIGERLALFVYAILAIGLELVVWLVPSLIGGAVAVSLVGVLLGPFYPIAMNHAGRIIPQWLLTGSIGWIAGFGQAGSAILPFVTGTMASRVGIQSLQPFLVAMTAFIMVLWALVPPGIRSLR